MPRSQPRRLTTLLQFPSFVDEVVAAGVLQDSLEDTPPRRSSLRSGSGLASLTLLENLLDAQHAG